MSDKIKSIKNIEKQTEKQCKIYKNKEVTVIEDKNWNKIL